LYLSNINHILTINPNLELSDLDSFLKFRKEILILQILLDLI
jgi:hypothetical protein